MQLFFLALARDELAEAKRFYNRQQQGLGESFQREAEPAAKLIQERPLAWQIEVEPVRRFLFDRFLTRCFTSSGQIAVIAIAHQHRQPDYWVDRVDPA